MSRNKKIALGIVGGLALLCVCGCVLSFIFIQMAGTFFEQSIVEDPAEVERIGAGIAEYELPPDYSEEFGMELFGFSMVAATAGDAAGNALILMMQFPQFAGLDQAAMEQQMEQSIQRQMNTGDLNLQVVDQTTTTIRDQNVTLTIREGTDSTGTKVRQVTGVFLGQDGPTLLMILGPIQSWDQAAIDAFISSIR